jgi:hypothetical protein
MRKESLIDNTYSNSKSLVKLRSFEFQRRSYNFGDNQISFQSDIVLEITSQFSLKLTSTQIYNSTETEIEIETTIEQKYAFQH